MDGRREPRFQIYASAKLTMLDSMERELDCLLLDISGAGLKFVSDEKLHIDEVVALEVEDHLVLADIRYSEQRGDRFVMGAERIHAMEKTALPENKPKPEQIRFVIDDYKNRIRAALASEQRSPKSEPPPSQYRDQIVESAVQKLLEQWAKEPAVSKQEGQEQEGPEQEAPEQETILRAAIVERTSGRVPDPTTMAKPTPVAQMPIAEAASIAPPIAPPISIAQPAVSSRWKNPVWRMRIATAGAIAMLGFTASIFWSYKRSVAADVSHRTASVSHPAVTAGPRHEMLQAPSVPVPPSRTSHAEIRVTEPVWVYAISDGKEVLQKLLAPDETTQIDFAEKALVRVGNAGGVEISVNGKPIGALGPSGKIRAIELTASGHRFVPLRDVEPASH